MNINDFFEEGEEIEQTLRDMGLYPIEEDYNAKLSFDDMDINEKLLLDLPVEEVVPITYITEMNSRFLHTFVDGCFVPA